MKGCPRVPLAPAELLAKRQRRRSKDVGGELSGRPGTVLASPQTSLYTIYLARTKNGHRPRSALLAAVVAKRLSATAVP